jgi:hypothetical protein
MMTQTPLSAARSTRRGEKFPTRPGVSAAARSSSFQPQASSLQNVYPEPQRAQPHPRNRFAVLIQFLRATDRGSRATEILIANLELEFRSTHRKISPLRISNRKYFAIFYLASQSRRPTSPNFQNGNSLVSAPLVCPKLRRAQPHPHKPFATSLNGREAESVPLAQPHPRNRFAALVQFLQATDHGSRATEILIDGSAIRNRRKALKT